MVETTENAGGACLPCGRKQPQQMGNVHIEEVSSPADLRILRDLFAEYAAELDVDLRFQGFQAELDGLPGLYSPPKGRLLLARCDTQPAGCVALRPLTGLTCEMKRLFVRTTWRRRQVGRLLAQRLLNEARLIGFERMVLDTLAHMTPAIRLYESLGFRRCPPYYPNPLPNPVYMDLKLRSGHL